MPGLRRDGDSMALGATINSLECLVLDEFRMSS